MCLVAYLLIYGWVFVRSITSPGSMRCVLWLRGCLHEKTGTGASFIPGWLFDFVWLGRYTSCWKNRRVIPNRNHPVYRQTAFTPKRVVVSRWYDTVARSRTGVKFSLQDNNWGEHTPGWLSPAWHLVVVSCKQIQSHERERKWTRSAAKIAPVSPLFINIRLSFRPQTYCSGKEIVSDMTQTTIN